jgi:ribosome-binding protein aMBF1 (putative translation factor)
MPTCNMCGKSLSWVHYKDDEGEAMCDDCYECKSKSTNREGNNETVQGRKKAPTEIQNTELQMVRETHHQSRISR